MEVLENLGHCGGPEKNISGRIWGKRKKRKEDDLILIIIQNYENHVEYMKTTTLTVLPAYPNFTVW